VARVTSKLQVTVPKVIAQQFDIEPGDEIDWIPAGDGIRVVKRAPAKRRGAAMTSTGRLRQFDEATERQALRNQTTGRLPSHADRGWTREDLYRRGGAR